jgi:HlyD family secretion protein
VQNVITYDAVIQVANPDLKLFNGMTANVTILNQRRESVLKLPNAALRVKMPSTTLSEPAALNRPSANWAVVYIPAQNSKARAVVVKTGITDGNFTEVQQGDLREGDMVITAITVPGAAPARPTSSPGPGRF